MKSTREKLKRFFLTGAKPTQAQFAEWIDSCVIAQDDGIKALNSGDIELAGSLRVRGDIFIDGRCWLAESPQSAALTGEHRVSHPNQSVPFGTILLWCGSELPQGYLICDGKHNTPKLSAPQSEGSETLHYIIKQSPL